MKWGRLTFYLFAALLMGKWIKVICVYIKFSIFLSQVPKSHKTIVSSNYAALPHVRCKKVTPPALTTDQCRSHPPELWQVTWPASLISALLPGDTHEPLIGQYRSRDMNTGLWLAGGDLTPKRKTSPQDRGQTEKRGQRHTVTRTYRHILTQLLINPCPLPCPWTAPPPSIVLVTFITRRSILCSDSMNEYVLL